MADKRQLTGMTGLYTVAAELSKRGFIASPTSRSAQGADLLVTDPACTRAFSVQVKTNAKTFDFWLMGEKNMHMQSESFVYAFVNLRKDRTEYFIVPSAIVAPNIKVSRHPKRHSDSTDIVGDALLAAKATKMSTWYSFYLNIAKEYQDNWEFFGKPEA